MEFKLSTDIAAMEPRTIDFNFDQLKAELAERTQHYNALVVTEDGIKDAKSDLANLRKLREAIESQRKEVKAACLRPYDAFEVKCRELTALIDSPISAIDVQIKGYDELQKAGKRASIEASFNAMVGDVAQFLPLERIWNARWLNATYKLLDIECELEAAVNRCQQDIAAIRGLDSPFSAELLEQYANGSSLSAALAKAAALKAREDSEAERRVAEAKKRVAVASTSTAVSPATAPAPTATDAVRSEAAQETEEAAHQIDFRVWATRSQLAALKAFLIQNNIKYGKVE